jgi:hypothetical protein
MPTGYLVGAFYTQLPARECAFRQAHVFWNLFPSPPVLVRYMHNL